MDDLQSALQQLLADPQQLAELTHYSAARSMLEELGIPIVEELSLV